MPSVVRARPDSNFVETPYVGEITERGLEYIQAGFPLHFRGPTGVGKTTLAMHVASRIGRPVMLISGDDEFGSGDLVGGATGYNRHRVVDRFIRSVTKVDESVRQQWVDNRLTIACREGLTLVYDEFTRSRPEANNVLLSVLEEGVLVLPSQRRGAGYLKVHPEFKAIFTSNPEEYAGVHSVQDALIERMVTMDVDGFDVDTEAAITQARSGVNAQDADVIVRLIRAVRELAGGHSPTVRSAVVIGRVINQKGATTQDTDVFETACCDVLLSSLVRSSRLKSETPVELRAKLLEAIRNTVRAPRSGGNGSGIAKKQAGSTAATKT